MKTIAQRLREEKLKAEKQTEEVVVEVYAEDSGTEAVSAEEINKSFDKLEDLSKQELQVMLEQHNIVYKKSWSKAKLIKLIKEN